MKVTIFNPQRKQVYYSRVSRQFFGLETGRSFLPKDGVLYAFSWSILMSLNVIASNIWGIILKEWKGVGAKTIGVLLLGLAVLIASIIVVSIAQQ